MPREAFLHIALTSSELTLNKMATSASLEIALASGSPIPATSVNTDMTPTTQVEAVISKNSGKEQDQRVQVVRVARVVWVWVV